MKVRARNLFLGFVAFFCPISLGYTQVGPTVEIPTAAHESSDSTLANNTIMGGEYKSVRDTKEIITKEEEPFWNWYWEIGYESQYNFHGTNLTPGADGAGFFGAQVRKSNFTLGISVFHQFGTASVGFNTTQTRFNELDLFIEYNFDIGPVEITFGDVEYFDGRHTKTFLFGSIFREVDNERANELSIRLATSTIPHFRPSITYYQTIYRGGFTFTSYLDGELRGEFAITRWLDFSPYGLISASFNEHRDGGTLSGFSHAQMGVELPIHLLRGNGNTSADNASRGPSFDLVPFGVYSYHISEPLFGTDRNEVWSGAGFELTF